MGALSESECRRINAAICLVENEQIPVEWLLISAGAKVNLDSGTEKLDWTATTLKAIIYFTQKGNEINNIVSGVNVGAQSYWNAESTMLMHNKGLLIMTRNASMLLTGKKALDFAGSTSGENNQSISCVEIMGSNGQAQIIVDNLSQVYRMLFKPYDFTYKKPGTAFPVKFHTKDKATRNIAMHEYKDKLNVEFTKIGDVFSDKLNLDRKKAFEMG